MLYILKFCFLQIHAQDTDYIISPKILDLALKQMFISNLSKIIMNKCPSFVWKYDSL